MGDLPFSLETNDLFSSGTAKMAFFVLVFWLNRWFFSSANQRAESALRSTAPQPKWVLHPFGTRMKLKNSINIKAKNSKWHFQNRKN